MTIKWLILELEAKIYLRGFVLVLCSGFFLFCLFCFGFCLLFWVLLDFGLFVYLFVFL